MTAMSKNPVLSLVAVGVLVAGTLICWSIFRSAKPVKLPDTISTVAAGYPFASKIKSAIARDAWLSGVLVDLDSAEGGFQVRTITYGFQTSKKDRTLFVQVDNTTHTAFALGVVEPPRDPLIPSFVFQELNLSNIFKDIPDVLKIAKADKLAEFCEIVPPNARQVGLNLGNRESGPTWSVVADGWDEKGPIADLNIQINPKTGEVISAVMNKGVGRP